MALYRAINAYLSRKGRNEAQIPSIRSIFPRLREGFLDVLPTTRVILYGRGLIVTIGGATGGVGAAAGAGVLFNSRGVDA